MRRQDLEHIIRAAADVTGDREIVVIGSQAILGQHPDAPRLVPIQNENTRQATGLCLEKHDLVLSKLAAGREKDYRFVADALREGIVESETLEERLESMPLSPQRLEQLRSALEGQVRRIADGQL